MTVSWWKLKKASAIGGRPEPKLTTSKRSWRSPFFNVVQIHPRLNIITIREASPPLRRCQIGAGFIAPAAFQQKPVPNLDFFLTRLSPVLKTPFENFLVRSALSRSHVK